MVRRAASVFYLRCVRCDFHVEGGRERWSQDRAEQPRIGELVEHRRKTYTVIDVAGSVGVDVLLVTLRRRIDEPAFV